MKPSVCCLAATLLAIASASAQQKFTAADYARAEQLMGYNTTPLVLRSGVRPNWLPDEPFWPRVPPAGGAEFLLGDPAKGTRDLGALGGGDAIPEALVGQPVG